MGDAAASLVGPQIYEEFVWPYESESSTGCTRWNPRAAAHLGTPNRILKGMGTLGCDMIDLDWMVPVEKARQAIGPNQVLAGNIHPSAAPQQHAGSDYGGHRRVPPPSGVTLYCRCRLRSSPRYAPGQRAGVGGICAAAINPFLRWACHETPARRACSIVGEGTFGRGNPRAVHGAAAREQDLDSPISPPAAVKAVNFVHLPRGVVVFGLLAVVVAPARAARPLSTSDGDSALEERLADAARYLSSDELEGRGLETRGIVLTCDDIADQFRKAGLQTNMCDDTPFQKFKALARAELGIESRLALIAPPAEGSSVGFRTDLALGRDFTPLAIGDFGCFDLPLAFVGYGVTDKAAGYDDYTGLDVSGKAVIVLRRLPQVGEGGRGGQAIASVHGRYRHKISNAFEHGCEPSSCVPVDRNSAARTREMSRCRRSLCSGSIAGTATFRWSSVAGTFSRPLSWTLAIGT